MYFVQQYGLPWVVFASNTRGPARAFKTLQGSAVVTWVSGSETKRAFFLDGRLATCQPGSAVTSDYLAHLRARRDLATLPAFDLLDNPNSR